MKKIFLLSCIISLIYSCSTSEGAESFNYEGVWKRIGTIKFENQVAVDTFYFPEGKVIKWKPMRDENRIEPITGGRYKIFGSGHSIWFYSRINDKIDSTGKVVENFQDRFAKTSYKIENDSLFETFNFWHDSAEKFFLDRKPGEIHFKAKLSPSGDNRFVQYRFNKDGNGWGELYEREDTYNINPSILTGVWKRLSTIRVRDGKILDTIPYKNEDYSSMGSYIIAGDKKRIWAFNQKYLNKDGVDVQPGSAQLSNYSFADGKITDSLVWANTGVRENYMARGGIRVREYSINDSTFTMKNINGDGNGGLVVFKRE